ncbi:HD-GYP domain-containing protein, partial [Acetomicrobium hydrogeniformans]
MLQAIRVPVKELQCCSGVVAEDVVSNDKALLLPYGSNLAFLDDRSINILKGKLISEGIEYINIYLHNDSDASLIPSKQDVSNYQSAPPLRQIDKSLAEMALYQINDVYNRIAKGDALSELYEPLLNTAWVLTQEILESEAITLSLYKVKERDEYTFVHSLNVSLLSGFLAGKLLKNDSITEKIVIGGLLHDVGKARIPLEILNKPGPLTAEEFAVMKGHPLIGFGILREAGIADETILYVTLFHHERIDGKGYPKGLTGKDIPVEARIVAVADVFDAVTTNRIYRSAESLYEAVSLIIKDTNKHFDPKVSRELVSALGLYPPGTIVELSDGSIAVVIACNEGDLFRPTVKLMGSWAEVTSANGSD